MTLARTMASYSPDTINSRMNSPAQSLILVDGTAYVYRAFFANQLQTSDGTPTGAVFGFANMLARLLREHSPDYIVVVFDAKGKTFRDEIYSEYKQNRPPMPDDLRPQYETIQQLVSAFGIRTLSIEGVEADDVIATLATTFHSPDLLTVIASSDKDLAQLVSAEVVMLDERKGELLGPSEVLQKFGVPPAMIIEYLALIGDTSDNIPGVPLVGPKTAVKWLTTYGGLDAIIANADSLPGKAGQNFRDCISQLPMVRQLITLKHDVKLDCALEEFTISERNVEQLRKIYTQLEFNTWLRELNGNHAQPEETAPAYQLVNDAPTFDALIEKLSAVEVFAFDTETTGLDLRRASLVGISISIKAKTAFYIPLGHSYLGAPEQLPTEDAIARLKPIFENPNIAKIAQNIKFDAGMLAQYGIEVRGIIYDTMIESYVYNANAVAQHSLDTLALKYLAYSTVKYEEIAGKGKKQITFDQVEIESAAQYACEDADITFRLHAMLWPKIRSSAQLERIYCEFDLPLAAVLMRMENYGVRIDRSELNAQSHSLQQRIEQVEQSIYREAGRRFNIASPKQIREILFDELGCRTDSRTSTGQASTSEAVLRELAAEYDLPDMILQYRSLTKLKSTYTDKLPELIDPDTQRVHTSYNQCVAGTGRLSSSDPNLQNIPIRTDDGKRIREAFIAAPGHVLISVDYSQIELRIMAHIAEDPGLIDAFSKGEDVHRFTASQVFGAPLDNVTSDQRRSAKAINFGLMYGMSAYGLSKNLQISLAAAKLYMEQYFERYPNVHQYMNRVREQAHADMFVETLYGRRMHLTHIRSKQFNQRQAAERAAINAPLQGTAADIIKLAMIKVDRWLSESGSGARMIMQVHDELVLESPETEVSAVVSNVKAIMEDVAELRVPLVADAGIGLNWASAHD